MFILGAVAASRAFDRMVRTIRIQIKSFQHLCKMLWKTRKTLVIFDSDYFCICTSGASRSTNCGSFEFESSSSTSCCSNAAWHLRERAQALILAGKVLVNGQKIDKAGAGVEAQPIFASWAKISST